MAFKRFSVQVAVVGVLLGVLTMTAAALAPERSRRSDEKLAKAAALSLSDFPSGWRTTSPSKGSDTRAAAQKIPACRSYVQLDTLTNQQAQSGNRKFAESTAATVTNIVWVFPTAKAASGAYALFGKPSTSACLKGLASVEAAKSTSGTSQTKILGIDYGQASVDPIGDRTTAYQGVISLSAAGQPRTLTGDLQLVQVGRSLTLFDFSGNLALGGAESDLRSTLLGAVVDRLPQHQTPTTTVVTTSAPSATATSSPVSYTAPAPTTRVTTSSGRAWAASAATNLGFIADDLSSAAYDAQHGSDPRGSCGALQSAVSLVRSENLPTSDPDLTAAVTKVMDDYDAAAAACLVGNYSAYANLVSQAQSETVW